VTPKNGAAGRITVLMRGLEKRDCMLALKHALLNNKRGTTAAKYGLIAALLALAAVTAMNHVGTNLASVFNSVATKP
jgi:pilus assembly protein Flp/PilA